MSKKIIKIKIGLEETKVSYSEKFFKTRIEAIEAAINHLQRMVDEVDFNNV